jgi:hypothetical protein
VTSGRLTRWLPARPRITAATVASAGFGAAAADLAIVTLLGSQLVTAPGTLAPAPVTTAVVSLTRLTFARHCARAAHTR